MAWPQLFPLCCTPVTWQPRPWTHKDCMDTFRWWRRSVCTLVQYMVIGFLLFVLIVWIGSIFQQRAVDRAPDTAHFYNTSQVCGLVYSNLTSNHNLSTVLALSSLTTNVTTPETTTTTRNNQTFTQQPPQPQQQDTAVPFVDTFASVETLQGLHSSASTDAVVLHCETCGACSNDHDVGIYDETRNTLTETAIYCAKRALIWGRRTAGACLARKVGFTPPCHRCWIDNILCDIRYCLFLCLWTRILDKVFARGGTDNGSQRQLTACTTCDEKRCGPDFIRCAGANRRRSGIVSDIVRNDDQEVCTAVNLQWWKHRPIQDAFDQIQHTAPAPTTTATTTSESTTTTTTTFSNDEPPHHHLRRLLGAAAATQT